MTNTNAIGATPAESPQHFSPFLRAASALQADAAGHNINDSGRSDKWAHANATSCPRKGGESFQSHDSIN